MQIGETWLRIIWPHALQTVRKSRSGKTTATTTTITGIGVRLWITALMTRWALSRTHTYTSNDATLTRCDPAMSYPDPDFHRDRLESLSLTNRKAIHSL